LASVGCFTIGGETGTDPTRIAGIRAENLEARWSWCVRGNEVTAVVVWRDNNDARLRLCDRPLIRSYEGYFRYTPDAETPELEFPRYT
jgi:hypothetical protein